jgi:GT2 family glycosyltransferase
MKKIGVLIVTYNKRDILTKLLQKFCNLFNKQNLYLLVLDNNSSDSTYEKLRKRFPSLDIRKLNDNYGCVTGRNIGIVELINKGCDYIFSMDDDIEIEDKTFFDKMLYYLESNKQIDVCCPVIRWADNKSIQSMGRKISAFGIPKNVRRINLYQLIDIIPGGAAFYKAPVFRVVGLYDNDLSPVSIEDLEWSIRARNKGIKFACNYKVEVIHHRDRLSNAPRALRAFAIRGRVIFLRKYFGVGNLLSEIMHILGDLKNYGLFFILKNYYKGFLKKINNNNYDFRKFTSHGLAQYYTKD